MCHTSILFLSNPYRQQFQIFCFHQKDRGSPKHPMMNVESDMRTRGQAQITNEGHHGTSMRPEKTGLSSEK